MGSSGPSLTHRNVAHARANILWQHQLRRGAIRAEATRLRQVEVPPRPSRFSADASGRFHDTARSLRDRKGSVRLVGWLSGSFPVACRLV